MKIIITLSFASILFLLSACASVSHNPNQVAAENMAKLSLNKGRGLFMSKKNRSRDALGNWNPAFRGLSSNEKEILSTGKAILVSTTHMDLAPGEYKVSLTCRGFIYGSMGVAVAMELMVLEAGKHYILDCISVGRDVKVKVVETIES